MITSCDVGIYHETQKGSPKVVYEVEKEYREEYGKKDQSIPFRQWWLVH